MESNMGLAGVWDVVVTCFFIDTAHNIVEYIEIISKILKDGGVSSWSVGMRFSFSSFFHITYSLLFNLSGWQIWINLGPLLYHFADMYGQEDVSFSFAKYILFHPLLR